VLPARRQNQRRRLKNAGSKHDGCDLEGDPEREARLGFLQPCVEVRARRQLVSPASSVARA
jgi:hypothetical protein